MEHKSDMANKKKAENPLAQGNWHSIFSSTGTSALSHFIKIPFGDFWPVRMLGSS